MNFYKIALVSFSVLVSFSAYASSNNSMENRIRALQEDIRVLQREAYRAKGDGANPTTAADISIRMSEIGRAHV